MANNEERYCNICNGVRLFILESDMLWYCDDCDNVYESNNSIDDDELDYLLEEFEEENAEAVVCKSCNNFIAVQHVLQDGICNICQNDIDDELLEKGYSYDEDELTYYK